MDDDDFDIDFEIFEDIFKGIAIMFKSKMFWIIMAIFLIGITIYYNS